MNLLAPITEPPRVNLPRLPVWALSRGRDIGEPDAAFAAGIALKSLDDLVRADPPWLACWRDRLALKSAAVAAKMLDRNDEENALRDAVLLTSAGDDPGPAGRLFLATRMLTRRSGMIGSPFVRELAEMLGLRSDDGLASILDMVASAIQSLPRLHVRISASSIDGLSPDEQLIDSGLERLAQTTEVWPQDVASDMFHMADRLEPGVLAPTGPGDNAALRFGDGMLLREQHCTNILDCVSALRCRRYIGRDQFGTVDRNRVVDHLEQDGFARIEDDRSLDVVIGIPSERSPTKTGDFGLRCRGGFNVVIAKDRRAVSKTNDGLGALIWAISMPPAAINQSNPRSLN